MSDGMTVMNGGCSEPAEAAGGAGMVNTNVGTLLLSNNYIDIL